MWWKRPSVRVAAEPPPLVLADFILFGNTPPPELAMAAEGTFTELSSYAPD